MREFYKHGAPTAQQLSSSLEEQLMQLGPQIAFENYRARWNRIFNVESDNLYTPQPNKSQESRAP